MLSLDRWMAFVTHDIVKYLLAAGGVYVLVYGVLAARLASRRLQTARSDLLQIGREVGWSLVSAVIFGTASSLLVIGPGELGWNRMYFDIGARGWPYALFTLALMIVAHDAYFYWTHRLLHHPVLMRRMHRTHHLSRTPTPWTAYALHPSEAVVQVAFPPLFAALIPLHPLILLLWSVHMVVRNVLGHAGFELMPAGFARCRWLGWLSTATHHDLHHETFRWNYGLYFTWWDRLMGTEHPDYLERFDAATGALRKPEGAEATSRL
jgi:sterol desaturase/sphingolipid hydroxylase (fatty acid hydroxylase superfamily)